MAKIWTREENELLKELTLKGKSRQEVVKIFIENFTIIAILVLIEKL